MAATQAYRNWDRAGRPWKVAAPVKAVGDRLRGYGYVIYYLGSDDSSHLQSSKPEDHCPFSFSGWPAAHPYPYITAFDVMPPRPGSGLPSLQQLGAQLVKDRNANHPGVAWLKYINFEPDRDNGGRCFHDSWQPEYVRTASNDRGHIHASGRSDMVAGVGAAAAYDPVARIRNPAIPTTTPEERMLILVQQAAADGKGVGPIYVADGVHRRIVSADSDTTDQRNKALGDVRYVWGAQLRDGGKVWVAANIAAFGILTVSD